MGSYFKGIILVIVLLFLITFGVKNNHPVQLNYYFNMPVIDIPVYCLAYVCIVIGIFVGMVVGISRRFSLHRTVKTLNRENKELAKRLAEQREIKEG